MIRMRTDYSDDHSIDRVIDAHGADRVLYHVLRRYWKRYITRSTVLTLLGDYLRIRILNNL